MTSASTLAIRAATVDDDTTLATLSALDSALLPVTRPALMAVIDGKPVAAASLADSRIVADPFSPTADAVDILRSHVGRVLGERAARRRVELPVPRVRLAL